MRKWGFPYLSLQFITSMCMSPSECQTGFKMMYAKPCLGKISTSDMALKQPQNKAEMETKLMTEDMLKLHSNKEKCKQNSKMLTMTWFFPQYRKQKVLKFSLWTYLMLALRRGRPVWNGFRMIHELTGKQSVNRKN